MRLYLSKKEAIVVKSALRTARLYSDDEIDEILQTVLERMELCEQLQNNERKGESK